jgi:hypothetical protein
MININKFNICSKYIINKLSVASREYRFSSTGTALLVKSFIYAIRNNRPIKIMVINEE